MTMRDGCFVHKDSVLSEAAEGSEGRAGGCSLPKWGGELARFHLFRCDKWFTRKLNLLT